MKLSLKLFVALLILVIGTAAAFAQSEEMYKIKPGDRLNIYVHDNNDLTQVVTVLPDGTISYPLVGNLYVEGLTTSGLADILTEKLGQFLQRPVVVITITSETLYKIYVMGEVRMPSAYPFEEKKRLTDYLAMAGGPTTEANLKKCNVYPLDSTEPRVVVNLKDIFDDEDRTKDIELQANDTILLERRSGFIVSDWAEIAQVFSVIFGAASIYFIAQNAR
ncbi:MAG TPA: polysaccharide biosynthesis/export family protein [bacterium]